nr:hypothetical protein [Bacteroidales bacterium]
FLTVGLSQARSLSLVLLLSFHSLKELFYLSLYQLRHSRVTSLSKAGAKVLRFSLSSKYFCNFFEKNFHLYLSRSFSDTFRIVSFCTPCSLSRLPATPRFFSKGLQKYYLFPFPSKLF